MILAVDIGNTHVVMGCIENSEIKYIARMTTDVKKTENEYAITIKQLLEFNHIDYCSFEGAIISSVVPPITGTMKTAIRILTGIDALVVGAGIKTGLNIRIDNPAQLGSDLVVGAVAALSLYKPPMTILDMGTATTISVIDAKGTYMGGAIIPGLVLSLTALSSGTSQLPKVPIEAPDRCIGANTIDCMKSGGVFGTAAMIDGMIERIEGELGTKTCVIATGGLSKSVLPHCKHDIIYNENLLLHGLEIIYRKNQKNK